MATDPKGIELEPCPFCGGSDVREALDTFQAPYAECACGASGPSSHTSNGARRVWNTRSLSTPSVGEDAVEALVAKIDAFGAALNVCGRLGEKQGIERDVISGIAEEFAKLGLKQAVLAALSRRTGAVSEGDGVALNGYRAAVSFIGSDAWDGCSDCMEILRAARTLDVDWDWAGDPNRIAQELRRVRGTALSSTVSDSDGVERAVQAVEELFPWTPGTESRRGLPAPEQIVQAVLSAVTLSPPARDVERGLRAVIAIYEAGQNHDAAHFSPDCQTCLILADLRAVLVEQEPVRECPDCQGKGEFWETAPGLPRAPQPHQCDACYGTGRQDRTQGSGGPDGEAGRCTMGVGCDEAGVCYAEANGQPEQCPRRGGDQTISDEAGPLVEFFRNEGFDPFGRQGDYEGWSTEETAVHYLREHLRCGKAVGEWPADAKFAEGATVEKKGRAVWQGHIVGWYRTSLTSLGYAVENHFQLGSVQIYPESALILWEVPAGE